MGFGKDGKGVIIREFRTQALGALAGTTGILIGSKIATLERFRMLKSEIQAVIVAMASLEGVGLALYLVDGEYTLAEFEAAMELVAGPVGPNDRINEELAERFILWAGSVNVGENAVIERQVTNEHGGGLLSVKPRWTFARTKSWNWILYNHGSTLTTGATVKLYAKDFGVWVT